jgi:hypothetical protein
LAYVVDRPVVGEPGPVAGDIVVVDPNSWHQYYITNDNFDDVDPLWSPDGRSLLFESNRMGIHYTGGKPGQYLIFNLDTKQLTVFGRDLWIKHPEIFENLYTRPAWTRDGKSLLIYVNRTIYIADTSGKDIRPFWRCPGKKSIIEEMNLSPNGFLLAISYFENPPVEDSGLPELAFIDLRDTSLFKSGISIYDGITWNNDGISCLVRSRNQKGVAWYEYSTMTRQFTEIKLPSTFVYADYIANGKIAGLASHDTSRFSEFELVIYDLRTYEERWITSDGIRKFGLSAFHTAVK